MFPLMKLTVENKRALRKGVIVVLCVLLLCGSFLAVPYIAAAIPTELAYYLTSETPPVPIAALPAAEKTVFPQEESTPAEISVDYEEESSIPPAPAVPPDGALTVIAESFCWYADTAQATLDTINRTNYSVNLYDYLERDYPIRTPADTESEPLVLIIHTHGTESYLPAGVDYYLPDEDFRSTDPSETVVAVGEEIAETLRSMGISVLHDTAMYDITDYNNSYTYSRAAVRQALEEYPSILYVLDVHRDSIFAQDDTCEKTLTEIDGVSTAQLMLVIGTDEGGADHPNWRQNLTVATHLEEMLNRLYPTLARPINLRTAAFNQGLSTGSLLLEVGSCGNTIEEACTAGRLFAVAFAALLKEQQ